MNKTVASRIPGFFLGLLMAVWLAGCGSGSSDTEPPPPPVTGTVTGLAVSATTGAPLAGVAVSSGTASTTTGADGTFNLTAVTPGAAVVSFSATDHARSHANATVAAGQTASVSVRLTPIGTRQTTTAAAGATVSVPGTPAQVSLPAAGIVDRNGAAFAGTMTVELTPINPALDPGNMPGDMTTRLGDGTVQPIESFGALAVNLQDGSGNKLNLAAGTTATVRIPLATRSAAPPATVPLFYFNETTGLWVQEGTATLQGTAPNQYYEGTVTHFTTWNADQVANTIRVTGCVQEANAVRVAGALVRADGVDYSGVASAVSDASGNFIVSMRRGSKASVSAAFESRYTNTVTAGPSEGNISLANCLALGNGTPVFVVQPVSQSITEGGYVVLQAFARGQAPIRYQWQRDGVNVALATTSVLLLDPVRNADNGAVYRAVASNGAGSTPSDAATITVASLPPAFAVQPTAQAVVAGTSATFTVQMLPQGAPLQYQWLRNGQVIDGAIAASYTLAAAQLTDSGASFSVRVTNSVAQVVSTPVLLTVTAAPVAPGITQAPANASVAAGQSAQFSVVASGSAPLSYQWRRGGTDIEGARSAIYTLTTTALTDSGAVFSVVVTNSAGSITSAGATLTVTPPSSNAGYYLVAEAGARASGSIVYANGAQSLNTPALVAVNADNPAAGAVTIEVAGAATPVFATAFEATLQGDQVSGLRTRFSFYFRNSRLYRLDHRSSAGAPVPQVVSSLTTADVCGEGGFPFTPNSIGSLEDAQDPTHSWVIVRGPGADNQCNTPDDNYRAARADMSSTTAPITLAGRPVEQIHGTNGALIGAIVVEGQLLRRVDATLGNAVTLRTLITTNFGFQGGVFGTSLPGTWLFVDDAGLYAYRLDGTSPTPQLLATRTEAERLGSVHFASQGSTAFAVLSTALSIGSGSRILSIGENLTVTDLGVGPSAQFSVGVTPTRLIFMSDTGLTSMPRAGGAITTLANSTQLDRISQFFVAGENIYYSRFAFDQTFGQIRRVGIIGSDGSNAQTLDAATVIGATMAATVNISSINDEGVFALLIAQGLTSDGQFAGSTLRSIDGATRATLVTYGTVPATPSPSMLFPAVSLLQYGQPGLLSLFSVSNELGGNDLLYFDSDSVGLTRVTNSIAVPTGGKMRPLMNSTPTRSLKAPSGLLRRLAPAPAAGSWAGRER